jgi:sugar lactone lactonase YvrE
MRSVCFAVAVATLGSSAFAQDAMVYPLSVVAKGETIFVADRSKPGTAPAIWKIEGGKAEVFFKGQKKYRTPLNAVRCLAIDHEGKLLAGDSATRDIYRFGDDGKPVALTGGKIGIPMSIVVTKDGTIYVADLEVHRIWKVPAKGGKPEEFAVINSPRGLALDKDERLWILSTSSKDGQIQRADKDGKLESIVKDKPFQMPHNIVVTEDGTAFVTDNYAGAVWKVSVDGKPEKAISGEPMKKPVGLYLSGKEVLIADPHARAIFSGTLEGGSLSADSVKTIYSAVKPKAE